MTWIVNVWSGDRLEDMTLNRAPVNEHLNSTSLSSRVSGWNHVAPQFGQVTLPRLSSGTRSFWGQAIQEMTANSLILIAPNNSGRIRPSNNRLEFLADHRSQGSAIRFLHRGLSQNNRNVIPGILIPTNRVAEDHFYSDKSTIDDPWWILGEEVQVDVAVYQQHTVLRLHRIAKSLEQNGRGLKRIVKKALLFSPCNWLARPVSVATGR
jgi:hypothetical protein